MSIADQEDAEATAGPSTGTHAPVYHHRHSRRREGRRHPDKTSAEQWQRYAENVYEAFLELSSD